MLIALWSPKGGSGTSVFAAACSLVLARHCDGVRLADLDGDQPAIFGLGADPPTGLADWLAAGPEAPTEALERLTVEATTEIALLPRGSAERSLAPVAAAEAGAVVRGCYLALRRAVHAPGLARSSGVVLVDEAGRSLGAREVADVLDRRVLARVPVRAAIARAVDAGILAPRLPDALARAATEMLAELGLLPVGRRAA